MKPIDLQKLNILIDKFIDDRDWNKFHSPKNLAMALIVECGELVEIFQWLNEKDSDDFELKQKIQEEVADIFIYLLRIVKKFNIDIESATIAKINKNSLKYPIEKSKGNSKKYNEL